MAYPIERKLVIAIASSALFDLKESDTVFRDKGESEYRKFQIQHVDKVLEKGVAFSFIRRFLNLNKTFSEQEPVEVVLLSRNDPETGLRVLRSIRHYDLNISRAAFLTGKSPFPYIPAFNATLFLSANIQDVKKASDAGFAAGRVLETKVVDDVSDPELRIAFDFDGVIAGDEAERVYQKNKDMQEFHNSEKAKSRIPLQPGPIQKLFKQIGYFQKLENKRQVEDPKYKKVLRTAIITARNAPSHERVVTTLRDWGVFADETFFLGGIEKRRVLEIMKPHIYFDDQMGHLERAAKDIPSVHIPFGISNQ